MSRPVLESKIFERVRQRGNIRFHQGVVTDLETYRGDFIGAQVDGESIDADFGVIAGGQNFPARLLKGFVRREKTQEIRLTYRTAVLEGVSSRDCKQRYYQVDPTCERYGGVVVPIENGRHMMTLIEYGDAP